MKYFNTLIAIGGLGLLLLLGGQAQASTMAICTGFGPGPSGNEFNNTNCDYDEIGVALDETFTSNDDLVFVAKGDVDTAEWNGLTVIETYSQDIDGVDGGVGTIVFETTRVAEIVVEKFDSIYQAYLFSAMTKNVDGIANRYSFMRDFTPLTDEVCETQGINCTADTSHVSTYVPIPAAVWLFGSALVGLIGIGRRRTNEMNAA